MFCEHSTKVWSHSCEHVNVNDSPVYGKRRTENLLALNSLELNSADSKHSPRPIGNVHTRTKCPHNNHHFTTVLSHTAVTKTQTVVCGQFDADFILCFRLNFLLFLHPLHTHTHRWVTWLGVRAAVRLQSEAAALSSLTVAFSLSVLSAPSSSYSPLRTPSVLVHVFDAPQRLLISARDKTLLCF